MPRQEKPLDPTHGPVAEFAASLRELRHAAGTPTYRVLATRTNYSISVLSQAAAGVTVPPWSVVKAFVIACDGDPLEWESYWLQTRDDQKIYASTLAQPLLCEPEAPAIFRDVRVKAMRHIVGGTGEAPAPVLRVYLLDDHEVLRLGLRSLLENEPDMIVIGDAAPVAEAKAQIPVLKPDVAILDVRLPDGNGINVCRHVRWTSEPGPACLIYTSYADVNEIYRAAWVGAAGFLLKGEPAEELVEAVRAVGRGNVLMDRSTVAMRNNLDRDSNPILTARVTYRERDILRLLADGLSNREIARKLVIAISTVENYVDSILNKLNVQSRTQAALLAADHLAKPYVW